MFDLTTRSRNLFSSFGQDMKIIIDGEIKGYTKLQDIAREEAIQRMRDHAQSLGANAQSLCSDLILHLQQLATQSLLMVLPLKLNQPTNKISTYHNM